MGSASDCGVGDVGSNPSWCLMKFRLIEVCFVVLFFFVPEANNILQYDDFYIFSHMDILHPTCGFWAV